MRAHIAFDAQILAFDEPRLVLGMGGSAAVDHL